MKKVLVILFLILFGTLTLYFVETYDDPPSIVMPVKGASIKSYDQNSFGSPRQGHSHKGVDIFARKGTPVISASSGFVIFTGYLSSGGKAVTVLTADLKFMYYAHLDTIIIKKLSWVSAGEIIGAVGNSGNARNTPPHLHFSICRLLPYKKFFNPVPILNSLFAKKERV